MVRIPISDKPKSHGVNGSPAAGSPVNGHGRPDDTFGAVAGEVAGGGGAYVPGGERTAPQDVDQANQQNQDDRAGDTAMQEEQLQGNVETQTTHLKPSSANPDGGSPPNPTGSENTGGANPNAPEGAQNRQGAPGFDDADAGGAEDSGGDPLAEAEERYRQLAADFHNYRQQVTRRETEARDRAVKNVISDLLPVVDNFERALEAARKGQDPESVRVGVEYILQQFIETLRSHGVEPLSTEGHRFDPRRHDAVEEIHSDEHEEGTIVDEAQRGYTYKGEVLRPSRVRVAGSKKNT